MEDRPDLEALIEQAQSGDAEAFRAIFDLYVDRIFNYALSRTSDREMAKDIAQDTFVDLWRSLGSYSYRGDASFIGFVFVILRRRIIKHYKGHRIHIALDNIPEIPIAEPRDTSHISSALKKLSLRYQEVLKLRYWGAQSFAEIGATLGVNETAARVLHHRALRQLQEHLDPTP